MLVAVPVGTAVGALLCGLLMLLCSFVFVKLGSIPTSAAPAAAAAAGAVGAFAAGWFSLKLYGSRGLITGASAGALPYLMIFACSISSGIELSLPLLFAKLFVFAAFGAAGGIVRVNKRVRVPSYGK